ncbi:MAG: undecaprenyl-phosphate glucose phosphotransferase [Gammaproteobacteria bacterium]|nr:undecaprenyl-phosphate glucose phosphotransferase [Gammaproteobacteria bacterium]
MRHETPLFWILRHLLVPFVVVLVLFAVMAIYTIPFSSHYLELGIITFIISSKIFTELNLLETWQQVSFRAYGRDMLIGWSITIGILLFLGFALKLTENYSRLVLTTWFLVVPFALLAVLWGIRRLLLNSRSEDKLQSVVIVGGNKLGIHLAKKISNNPYLSMSFKGFFDDRTTERLAINDKYPFIGGLRELPEYVKRNRTKLIYIALPMSSQPRIMRLLDALRDTTASIYFVPDLFVFDLAHARFGEVSGIHVIAVSETPFTGVNALIKRMTDLILSTLFLLLLSPFMLVIALGVKLSSPGPVLFLQQRYGLDGQEIRVRKFRTMKVMEDGSEVKQATRDDQRITRFGGFLRKTSLDELPQLINVLSGNMSLVGPRPHAVAHNEMYRSLIKGYMIRHKVKPGITGLAQVNGLRGETKTLDKMQKRVKYDINYLRNWSLALDLWVIFRTALIVFKDENAY